MRPMRGSTIVCSSSARLIPHTMPPSSWLSAVFAFSRRPTSYVATTRGTRISPRSAIDAAPRRTRRRTSARQSACLRRRAWPPQSPRSAYRFVPASAASAFTATRLVERDEPAPVERRALARQAMQRRAGIGDRQLDQLRAQLLAAACTAGPTLAAVIEPPDTGACGSAVSPSSKRTRLDGHAQRVGGDLRHHRVSAGADVLRPRLHDDRAVGLQRARAPTPRIRCAG